MSTEPEPVSGVVTPSDALDRDLEAELVPQGLDAVARPTALAVTPQVDAQELVSRLNVIRDAMETAMQKDIDYGRIPGVNKPTLLKPGAEKLGVLFQLDVQLDNEKRFDGNHLTVTSHAVVYHAPSGTRLGYGEGICTTKERKYAYRKQNRTCPECGQEQIIKGKQEYGGGWLCWKKQGGCGAKFKTGDPKIESQDAGEVPNPDLPDLWNTAVKMAEKRARIDAVLAVTGASALFTQDVEDAKADDAPPAEDPKKPPPPPRVEKTQRALNAGPRHIDDLIAQLEIEKADEIKPTVEGMNDAEFEAVLVWLAGKDPA